MPQNSSKMAFIIRLALLLVAAGLILLWIVERQLPRSVDTSGVTLKGSLVLLDGTSLKLENLEKKPLLLNFWATWCPPCLNEIPELERAFVASNGKVQLIGVAMSSPTSEIEAFVQQFGITYTIAFADTETANRFHPDFLPTTYLFDANGQVVWSRQGGVTEAQLQQIFKEKLGITID